MLDSARDYIENHKLLVLAVTTFMALLPISFIGWQVHYFFAASPPNGLGLTILDQVPLTVWKIWFWIAEMLAVAFYSIMAFRGYWLTTRSYMREYATGFLIGITTFYQWACGAYDWIWFLIHGLMGHVSEFPSLSTVWWWNPYHWFLGIEWTTFHHIIYFIILETIFISAWLYWHFRWNRQ